MAASSVPYIGSKISLVSNSEIRYEGTLYTINTTESTIALQSVRCFGTEGRKMPEIPPSSEVYDFIIFRGQDIKDLTVLESTSAVNDPAIVSINQKPAGKGGAGKAVLPGVGGAKGAAAAPAPTKGAPTVRGGYDAGADKGAKGRGAGWTGGAAWGAPATGSGYGGNAGGAWGWAGATVAPSIVRAGGGGGAYGGGASYGGGYGTWTNTGAGKGAGTTKGDKGGKKGDFKGAGKVRPTVDSKGGKKGVTDMKGGKATGAGKGKDMGKSKDSGKGKGSKDGKGKGDGKKGGDKGGKRSGGGNRGGGGGNSTVLVGELHPEENVTVKKEVAEDFDVMAANNKFEKVSENVDGVEARLKPLTGYDKTRSFFDSISCEATERPAESERPKIDREKAREFDKETFGETKRPPRPAGGRPGKGRRRGGEGA